MIYLMLGFLATNIMNVGHNWCVEQGLGRRVCPVLVLAGEVNIGQVASDTGHCNGALAPWLPEIKVERVVLYVLVPRVVLFCC